MRIGILGPLEVVADGRPIEVGGARLRTLLTLLALEAGRTIPADRIIGDLWEERAPAAAPNALQALVSRLRSAIGHDLVESKPGAYRLVVPRDSIDAHDFEARVLGARQVGDPEARAAGLRDALALWRGPALADAGGLPFADGPAARLEGLRLAALDERIDADLALGRHEELIPELQAMTAADPLSEPLRRRLIRALYGAGRQAGALAEYESIKRALADALGVDPSPELEKLHVAVLRQDRALTPSGTTPRPAAGARAPQSNLRAPLTSFIGRDEDLARVGKLLAEGRLVTLTGPGGSGKTRLALESAGRQLDRMADGVWVVELAPVTDPAEVALAVLTTLRLRETVLVPAGSRVAVAEFGDPLERLATALAEKRMLLVLDNCEHLLDASARLADQVLAACPGVRVLATSREPLGITGETLWPVEPLEPPPPGTGVADAMANPAVRLLTDRAAAVSPGFAITPANVASIVQICRALDGMPLAIELAAVRLRAMTPPQLAGRLDDRFRVLATGSRTALPRHQTLRAVVEWSWDLLDEAERVLWRRLSIFTGGATLESAERVCSGPGLDPSDVLDVLTALVDKSLLVVTAGTAAMDGDGEPDGLPRYRMLETIRAYGAERLAEAGEEGRVRRAHAEYFTELAETAEPHLFRHDQIHWLRRLTAEHDELQTALRWTFASGAGPLAVRLCASLGWYWFLRGGHQEAADHFTEVLSMPGLPDDEVTATALAAGVMFTFDSPRDDTHIARWLERAERICEALGDRPPQPILRVMLATMRLYQSGWDTGAVELVADLFDEPDPWIRGMGYFVHSQVAINFGLLDGVDADLREAVRNFREAGDRWGLSFTLMAQADLLGWRGEHAAAAGLYEEALDLNERVGGALGMFIQVHSKFARQLYILGERDRAKDLLAEALREAERMSAPEVLASIHQQFGEFAWRDGDRAEATRRFDRAEQLAPEGSGPPQFRALVLASRAQADASWGDLGAARARLEEALRGAARALDYPIVALVLVGHATVALREGRMERAAELIGTADGLRGIRDQTQLQIAQAETAARDALGEAAFTSAYERGLARSFDDVLADFGLEYPAQAWPGDQ